MNEILIVCGSILFVICYIPQLYTLWIKNKFEGYNAWFQIIESCATLLMLTAAIQSGISKTWIINYILCLICAIMCTLGWLYAKSKDK